MHRDENYLKWLATSPRRSKAHGLNFCECDGDVFVAAGTLRSESALTRTLRRVGSDGRGEGR
jgi:hypothetical protein